MIAYVRSVGIVVIQKEKRGATSFCRHLLCILQVNNGIENFDLIVGKVRYSLHVEGVCVDLSKFPDCVFFWLRLHGVVISRQGFPNIGITSRN